MLPTFTPLHEWTLLFGFPGFAETEWVLPAGVDHDDDTYEPLPWVFARSDLEGWALAPSQADYSWTVKVTPLGTQPVTYKVTPAATRTGFEGLRPYTVNGDGTGTPVTPDLENPDPFGGSP